MVETVLILLIQIAVVVVVCYVVIWFLGIIGVSLPPKVIQIFWVIVVLIVLLMLWRAFGGSLGRLVSTAVPLLA